MSEHDPLDDELHGLFARATADVTPPPDLAGTLQRRLAADGRVHGGRGPTASVVAATLSVVVVVALLGSFLVLRGHRGGTGDTGPQASATWTVVTGTVVPFTVSGVDVAVTPSTLAGMACGSKATFAYTATFHIPAGSAGGVIRFTYTAHSGQMEASPEGSLQVSPGQTAATITWSDSGALPPDNTWPPSVQVKVIAPNHVISNTARPTGACGHTSAAPFEVTNVGVAVSPASLNGAACGASFTETYTATFQLAANGPGGTIQFTYTTDNGRGSNPASLTVAPGQTTATYQFQWSGALPPDHTAPEGGGVMVSGPNTLTSPLVGPTGQCS